jgi:hypothetical protein
MIMGRQDDDQGREMERYLKRFQPRSIRPLQMPPQTGSAWLLRLAVAAGVTLAGGLALWYAPRQTAQPSQAHTIHDVRSEARSHPRMSTLALTELAVDNSKAFDSVLAERSRTMFPSMQGEGSALRVLAKE